MTALELARFALYADLGLAFGVPAAALLTRAQISPARPVANGAVLIGLPLSIIAFLLSVAEMTGTGLADLDWQLAGELAASTPMGWAFLARIAALGLAVMLWFALPRRISWQLVLIGVALASLAWSGHAAAGEGMFALPQLGADIVHLLSASIWFGALALFLALLRAGTKVPQESAAALERFASVGSVLVALLALTGLANLWLLMPLNNWRDLLSSRYGELLAIKLGLFFSMLMLAALNRFVLVPEFARSGRTERAQFRLRFSIALEFCAVLAILAIVARLGMMDPASS